MHKYIKLLPVLAIVAGISAALAFTTPGSSEQNVQTLEWFQFMGGDDTDPANYQKVGAPLNCDNGNFLCAIRTEEDPSNPGFPTEEGVEDPETTQTRSTPPTP